VSDSTSKARTQSSSQIQSGARAISQGTSVTESTMVGRATQKGTSRGAGRAQTIVPVYTDLPTSFHSKDNALYMAGERIRALPTGRAIMRFRNNVVVVNVPYRTRPTDAR